VLCARRGAGAVRLRRRRLGRGRAGDLGGGGGGGGPAATTLRIDVTDAPFPFSYVEAATVTIDEVRVHERNSDAWTTVFTGSKTIDLVPLPNGVSMPLVDAALPAGTYDMVRLIVDAGSVTLSEDAVVQGSSRVFDTANGGLFFPSEAQTGIKVGIENDIVVTTGLSSDLTLDFDLSRSFVFNGPVAHAPGVRRVIFTPSVRATNTSTAGSIGLTVISDSLTPADMSDDVPISGATVRVFAAGADMTTDAPVETASTDASGMAMISLPPGTYDLLVEATGHESETILGVSVTLANLTNLGDVTLAATGTISGVVMSDGGTPADTSDDVVIGGVTVDVHLADDSAVLTSTTTDSNGAFQVGGLAAGMYDLTFQAPGFNDLSVPGVAATLTGTGQTFLMSPFTAIVSGTLTDSTSATVSGATVTAMNSGGVLVGTTTTADNGTYSLILPTGSYTISFTDGTTTVAKSITIVGASPPSTVTLDAQF
jgi:hypothetical protein